MERSTMNEQNSTKCRGYEIRNQSESDAAKGEHYQRSQGGGIDRNTKGTRVAEP